MSFKELPSHISCHEEMNQNEESFIYIIINHGDKMIFISDLKNLNLSFGIEQK